MRVDDPRCLPSVGRSELPSVSSIPSRALRPEASVNVHEGVRRTVRRVVSGARASASFDATSEMSTLDLAPAPRRLDPCRSRSGGKKPTASLGHDCTTDLCNACSTRGHAREPGILLRARLPPPSAFAPVTVSRRRELPDRVPLARRVSGSASPRSPAHVSFGAGDEFCPRLVEGSEHDP